MKLSDYGPVFITMADAARFNNWEEFFEDYFGGSILTLIEREWIENG